MSTNISKHTFGSRDRVEQALLDGKISAFDVVMMEGEDGTGEFGWINKEGNLVVASPPPITVKTTNEWLNNDDYVPRKGEIVVYSDYKQIVEGGVTKNIPSLKIGDGVSPIRQLFFVGTGNDGGTSGKLEHSLTIGTHVFDGTADIVIPIYEGE